LKGPLTENLPLGLQISKPDLRPLLEGGLFGERNQALNVFRMSTNPAIKSSLFNFLDGQAQKERFSQSAATPLMAPSGDRIFLEFAILYDRRKITLDDSSASLITATSIVERCIRSG
jgi:hypothetical protein